MLPCLKRQFYKLLKLFRARSLLSAISLSLLCKHYLAHAEENAVTPKLQSIAGSYTQEIGDVPVQDHWTRIEFSAMYIDQVTFLFRAFPSFIRISKYFLQLPKI